MHLGNATISNDACSLSPRGTSGERVGERGSFPQFRRSLGCPSPPSFIVGKGNPLLAMVVVSTSVQSATPNRHEMVPLVKMLPNDEMNPIFLATVQATEEAVVNAMVAAETMTGINDHTVIALPHDKLREALKKYNRLTK